MFLGDQTEVCTISQSKLVEFELSEKSYRDGKQHFGPGILLLKDITEGEYLRLD